MDFFCLYVILFNMELILIKQDSPEWEFMWNWVYAHPVNDGLAVPDVQQWQYKGSLRNGDRILHQFNKAGKSLVLACSPNMLDTDIHRIIQLK
jgi:hypothetical protein